jgi:hypothetical protein
MENVLMSDDQNQFKNQKYHQLLKKETTKKANAEFRRVGD